jgi:hypothetical protein
MLRTKEFKSVLTLLHTVRAVDIYLHASFCKNQAAFCQSVVRRGQGILNMHFLSTCQLKLHFWVRIFKPWKTPQITKECTIERLFHSQISCFSHQSPKKVNDTIGILQIMHVANIPDFEAPCVYLPMVISVMILHAMTRSRDAMCISLAQCVWERDGDRCFLTVVIDQKL